MTHENSQVVSGFVLDSSQLTKSAVTAVRVAFGVGGVATLAIGLLITFWPGATASAIALLLGIYWVITGVAYLVIAVSAKGLRTGSRVLDVVLGLLMVVAGIIVAANPSESAIVLGVFLGIYIGVLWLFEGVVTLLQSGDAPSRGWAICFGIISILAGLSLFTSPLWGIELLFWMAGIGLIVLGAVQLVRAFTFGRGLA